MCDRKISTGPAPLSEARRAPVWVRVGLTALCFGVPALSVRVESVRAASTRAPASAGTPAEGAQTSAADIGEIAARAAASARAGTAGEEIDALEADSYDAIARNLLQRIESIEKEHGHVARALEGPLFELGKLYVSADQCQNAIPILRQAILLSQRLDGVMNTRQLPLYEPLLECFVARDMLRDLDRVQNQLLLIHENRYGKDDVRVLPALSHVGAWYEQAGEYESARDVYARSLKIARRAGGEQDVRLVQPLRALARTYRLEMQYEPEALRGRALDAQGERTLERAARIVRMSPAVDPQLKIDTLLDLGDWYQMAGAVRDAVETYKEVWEAAAAAGSSGTAVLAEPQPILYRAAVGIALRRPPPDRDKLQHYWIDFDFTVTRFGEVRDVTVTGATAPKDLQLGVAENLKRTHYRPRFLDGAAVDTPHVRIRQGVWVSK
jgi:tetratricopeptide (TPR) repeat protein